MKKLSIGVLIVLAGMGCTPLNGESGKEGKLVAPDQSVPELVIAASVWTNARQLATSPLTNDQKTVYVLDIGLPSQQFPDDMDKKFMSGLVTAGWSAATNQASSPSFLYSKGDRMLELQFVTGMVFKHLWLKYWSRDNKRTPNKTSEPSVAPAPQVQR